MYKKCFKDAHIKIFEKKHTILQISNENARIGFKKLLEATHLMSAIRADGKAR